MTALSIAKVGAPFSDQPRLATSSVGEAVGVGTIGDGLEGAETLPDSFGEIVGVGVGVGEAIGVGDGVGVDVETSVGVGEGVGVSVGLGLCPNENSAMRNALEANPPARNFFRITSEGVECKMRQG
jgi:hypothetical protein